MDASQIAQIALALALGVSLSASCGFRVFIPPLILSGASMAGFVDLSSDFAWMSTWQATLGFATAAVAEVAAYYIPAVDNLLDTIAGPASAVAGAVMTAALIGGDVDPALRWALAAIAGGGTAFATTSSTAPIRAASTTATAGLGNGLFSTLEAVVATLLSIVAIALPVLGFVLAVVIVVTVAQSIGRIRSKRSETTA
ncbi:Uncharacterised protein [Slackia heliotrinireducens]|uniref:DUF4126 domain-containing protein n=1 Tax=Slackia heliotrinireducens (strain ATCC 29202 / DSM 20476 / NCTC 11029 / RHS 1) TaxID=471855 RepID=C7N453_SLAHD|nr:DUF4126 domain-containing protein [Slackia heliotrinireducens]ACV23789.1 hypothetical protein Shel_27970 [Slackia heliotrinireducens DSM 20476]VEH03447.1 Uncharacterised protein [Slackia heliotrinireducens]